MATSEPSTLVLGVVSLGGFVVGLQRSLGLVGVLVAHPLNGVPALLLVNCCTKKVFQVPTVFHRLNPSHVCAHGVKAVLSGA